MLLKGIRLTDTRLNGIDEGGFLLKSKLKKLLFLFIVIQPFLDLTFLYTDQASAIFGGFSIATILRFLVVAVIGILFVLCYRSKKLYLFLGIYTVAIAVYFGFHHWNALQFHSLSPDNFNYSLGGELFYIARMLLPLIILLVSAYQDYSERALERMVSWLVILISGSIVLSNLLKVGLSSYTNIKIDGSIFNWFFNKEFAYYQLTTKGFFQYANSIAALEILLTPLLFYFLIRHFNVKNSILVVIQTLALLMLGTRTAAFGYLGLLILTICMIVFFSFIKREIYFNKKLVLFLLVIIGIYSLILPKSPTFQRIDFNQSVVSKRASVEKKLKKADKKAEKEEKKDPNKNKKYLNNKKVQKVAKKYPEYHIHGVFIEVSYPYFYDPDFWLDIIYNTTAAQKMDFRYLEQRMLERVKEINNNPLDNWLGISYTRMNNIFNLERDFYSQYYSLGIIGMLLLMTAYILVPLYCLGYMLFHFKAAFTLRNCSFLLAVLMTLGISLYSGNVMDFLIVTLILAFFEGQLLRMVTHHSSWKKHKFTLIMPTYNDEQSIIDSLDSVRNQSYQDWELLIVDDGSTDQTRKIIEDYQQRYQLQAKLHYRYQENQDQLRAVYNAIPDITGDVILILHSDDLLGSRHTLRLANAAFNQTEVDGLMGDLKLINQHGKKIGWQHVLPYVPSKRIRATQYLWLGRNLFVDTAFWRKELFLKQVADNYLIWNTPHWLDFTQQAQPLNLDTVPFPSIQYRLHEDNYIHAEQGAENVAAGELRTLIQLMPYVQIPNYQRQYKIFRFVNKLKLTTLYSPIYRSRDTLFPEKAEIIEFSLAKRFTSGTPQNLYYQAITEFYRQQTERWLELADVPPAEKIYTGADIKRFNQELSAGTLPEFYLNLMEEMQKGFSKVRVARKDRAAVEKVLRFMCILPDVRIVELENEEERHQA